jgi:hypothetical protein
MSSIGSSLRQIPVATTYYDAVTVLADVVDEFVNANPQTHVFELVPDSGNYVGNYPPGQMIVATPPLVQAIAEAFNDNGGDINDPIVTPSRLFLRDMGKTIYAKIVNKNVIPSPPPFTGFGYFRQVQLLAPKAITATQGFLGGVNGTTSGVLGGPLNPDDYTNYATFYIAVSIGGVGLTQAATTKAYCLAGGQM